MWRKTEIKERLTGKPHLRPVYTHVWNIPERLRRSDRNLFVAFNTITQMYEIHSLENKGDSFSLQVPFKDLDCRIEDFVQKYDIRRHGRRIFDEIESKNEMVEKQNELQRRREANDFARELHPLVKKFAYWG